MNNFIPAQHAIAFQIVQLHPADNVAVCIQALNPGDKVAVAETTLIVTTTIELGHKIALNTIQEGEAVLKHGAKIGIASRDILLGEQVHIHNMKSDYHLCHSRQQGES